MLSKLKIILEKKEGLNQNISSVMQGILMEKIDEKYAEVLHTSSINPYSQSVWIADNHIEWTICTMTEEARTEIIETLLNDSAQTIMLNDKNIEMKVLGKEIEEQSYEELMQKTYFGNCSSHLELVFISPTAFKVDGRYQNYPTINHIFQSLIRKYDALAEDNEIFCEDLMRQIEDHVYVKYYNLRSTMFHLEGIRIPAFRGSITLKLKGPQMFINLMHYLAAFGEYSGVGIKSSIGMGRICRGDNKNRT